MSSGRTSIVSILNNDDNPSFAVRSAPRLNRSPSSQSAHSYQPEQQPAPTSEPFHARPHALPESPGGTTRHPFDPVTEAAQPTSPGSSDGSSVAYDYFTSQPSSSSAFHPYARQDLRRDRYRFPSRGPAPARTPPETRAEPPSEATASSSSSQTPSGTRDTTGRKNKYPCPYAASHGCTATFTTSGHAARHGKKHTGEKSVHCPICNKAFTRKDNMKQHIRTHRNTHSDEMRSASEPESGRWGIQSSSHQRTASTVSSISQSTETGTLPRPTLGP
ncbi:hypothetical protein N7474_000723 [Penicillium riverlandense]|uniref:uncharacterized protein n=1 Tax=Penicillium riverlandense TaxID=1903569 RepID=UPI00254755DF|nr:uncharacterized protein N7474_000723 [Penicillium riverlandense]KAJ5832412.1 hypothetical protein N7474_000723 [Penicillium riverlandense]